MSWKSSDGGQTVRRDLSVTGHLATFTLPGASLRHSNRRFQNMFTRKQHNRAEVRLIWCCLKVSVKAHGQIYAWRRRGTDEEWEELTVFRCLKQLSLVFDRKLSRYVVIRQQKVLSHIRWKYIQRQKRQDKRFILDLRNKTTFVLSVDGSFRLSDSFISEYSMWGQRRATHSFNQTRKTQRRRRRTCTDELVKNSTVKQWRTRSTEQLDADQTGTKCGPDGSSSPQLAGIPSPCFYTCTLEYLSENGWKHQNI